MATIKKACKGVSYPKPSSVSRRLKTGGSFPDLNKDGKVTKKDILIGKGVLPKTAKKGTKIKKAQHGLLEDGPLSAIPAAGAVKNSKQKERSADGNYAKVTKLRETPAGTKAVEKTRRTLQGFLRGAPRVANYKKGGKMKKCAYGCK